MSRDTTRRVTAAEARRLARIDQGKDPDDLSGVYHGRPTRPKKLKPVDATSTRHVPSTPLSLAEAASQLGIRPVQLAQAAQEGKVATIRGRGGELLIAPNELERVRRGGSGLGVDGRQGPELHTVPAPELRPLQRCLMVAG